MNKHLITTMTLLASLSLSVQASDQFYKWVDDKGVTHYSQSPPDDSPKTKAQTVNVSTRLPSGAEEAINNLAKQRSEAQKAQKAREDGKEGKEGKGGSGSAAKKPGEKDTKTASAGPDQYKDKCAKLNTDLQTLKDKGGRIQTTDAKGEVHTLTDEERAQRLDDVQRQIKGYCEK